jgi:predicted TIM-barrel fold metal-dependent hydrolase
MRNGYKVWDVDTHHGPSYESMEPYFDPEFRDRLPELKQYIVEANYDPKHSYRLERGRRNFSFGGTMSYQRKLGEDGPAKTPLRQMGKFMGERLPADGVGDDQVDLRIKEMDEEGVDVQLMVPGTPSFAASRLGDPSIEVGLIRAGHRLLDDFCCKYPHRLKSLLVASGNAVEESVEDIHRWGKTPWAIGIWAFSGLDRPLDHPDMEPIWKAAAEENLAIVHHSLAWTPPYFPGYRDMWDNNFLARSSSHPWGAQRSMASFIASGVMDRYPTLKYGILESGCGWLPFWVRNLEDHMEYIQGATAELEHPFSEYVTGGRFFSSIEMREGPEMIKMVMDFLGDGVLMYASDYPHPESLFPRSVDNFLSWEELDREKKQKLLWDNAVRVFGEP